MGITAYIVDIHDDRQYSVKVTGKVLVFDTETPAGDKRGETGVIDTLRPQDHVDVLRILNHDEFQAIKVRLRDGRVGYIFCCQNFEFSR